jgi:hypothetical protein
VSQQEHSDESSRSDAVFYLNKVSLEEFRGQAYLKICLTTGYFEKLIDCISLDASNMQYTTVGLFACLEPKQYLLVAMKSNVRRISLETSDVTDVILPLTDVHNVIAIDIDFSENTLYYTDVYLDVIRWVFYDKLINTFQLKMQNVTNSRFKLTLSLRVIIIIVVGYSSTGAAFTEAIIWISL